MKNKMKFIFYRIFLIILTIVCLLLLFYLISNHIWKTNNKKIPINLYTIVSTSMEPTIKNKDVILIIKSKEYKVDDIVTYKSNSEFNNKIITTHRITDIIDENNSTYYQTKGDNNDKEDLNLITKNDIYGKVILTIPRLGNINNFIANCWIYLIIILFLTSYLIYELTKKVRNKIIKEVK